MQDRRVIVFRSRLRDGVDDVYGPHAQRMLERARAMPGFMSSKMFYADDGERVNLIEWNGEPELRAWRELPEHAEAD